MGCGSASNVQSAKQSNVKSKKRASAYEERRKSRSRSKRSSHKPSTDVLLVFIFLSQLTTETPSKTSKEKLASKSKRPETARDKKTSSESPKKKAGTKSSAEVEYIHAHFALQRTTEPSVRTGVTSKPKEELAVRLARKATILYSGGRNVPSTFKFPEKLDHHPIRKSSSPKLQVSFQHNLHLQIDIPNQELIPEELMSKFKGQQTPKSPKCVLTPKALAKVIFMLWIIFKQATEFKVGDEFPCTCSMKPTVKLMCGHMLCIGCVAKIKKEMQLERAKDEDYKCKQCKKSFVISKHFVITYRQNL